MYRGIESFQLIALLLRGCRDKLPVEINIYQASSKQIFPAPFW